MYLIQRSGIYLPQTASEKIPLLQDGDVMVEIDPEQLMRRAKGLMTYRSRPLPVKTVLAEQTLPDLNTQREKEI